MAKKPSAIAVSVKEEERWRVESDMRTLIDAEAIRADAKRYAKVRALAKQKLMEVAKVAATPDEN